MHNKQQKPQAWRIDRKRRIIKWSNRSASSTYRSDIIDLRQTHNIAIDYAVHCLFPCRRWPMSARWPLSCLSGSLPSGPSTEHWPHIATFDENPQRATPLADRRWMDLIGRGAAKLQPLLRFRLAAGDGPASFASVCSASPCRSTSTSASSLTSSSLSRDQSAPCCRTTVARYRYVVIQVCRKSAFAYHGRAVTYLDAC